MPNEIPVKSTHREIKVYSIRENAINDLIKMGPAIREFLATHKPHSVGLANFHIAKQDGYFLLVIALDNDQTDWNEIDGFSGLLTDIGGEPDFSKFSDIDIP